MRRTLISGHRTIARRVLLAAACLSLACGGVRAQSTPPSPAAPAVPRWPADFTYLGKTALAYAPYPNDAFGSPVGDWKYGKGFAIHKELDGTISIYAGSWPPPEPVLRWKATPAADGTFAGNASFVRSLGSAAHPGEMIGLYLDATGAILASGNSIYDADGATASTLSRNVIDPATGKLAVRGTWKFATRSDKMTMGGLTAVPAWWRSQFQQTCNTLAGWGGYWSVIATGPVSQGPAATCFTLPGDADVSGTLANVPVLGFPYSTSAGTPATQRLDTDYWQTYGWGWWPPKVAAAPGWWNPGDWLYQGCAWVDNAALSGLVCMPMLNEGCNWYGSNAIPAVPPVCNATAGKAAALNSNRQVPWVFVYDPADLGAVATGARSQTTVQPVSQVPLQLPGVSLPFPGLPDMGHIIAGVAVDASANLFAILLRDASSTNARPSIYWYRVNGEARTPPRPAAVLTIR